MINYTVDQNIAVLSWHMTSTPMNVLNDDSIPALEAALQRAYRDPAVLGIIVTSEKNEFIAGADLKMILRNNDTDPEEMRKISTELNRVFRTIETSGKPAVAAINGTALGGGYELCLACHHRIALHHPKAWIGLPEVTLGLLPGGGGTQRLPRLLGLAKSLPLLLEGKRVSPQEALELGLVNELVATREELYQKAHQWIKEHPNALQPWDERKLETGSITGNADFELPGGGIKSLPSERILEAATTQARESGNPLAPFEIIAALREGLAVDIDRALEIEAQHFVHVGRSEEARNRIEAFFAHLRTKS